MSCYHHHLTVSSLEGTEALLTLLDRFHLYLTNSGFEPQWNQALPVVHFGIIIIITAQLLLATSFTTSRNSKTRSTKAPWLMISMSESMISALLGSEEHEASSMAKCATQVVGVVNAHLQSQRLNLGHRFKSLYRLPRSASQMLRKKNFLRLSKNFSLFKTISGTISCFGALISALHQNTKQFYMQVVHTSFSIQLPHYIPSYSVKKKFSKI